MPINLARLLSIAHGEIKHKKDVTHVTTIRGVATAPLVTPVDPCVTSATPETPQNNVVSSVVSSEIVRGVTPHVTHPDTHAIDVKAASKSQAIFWPRISNQWNSAAAKTGNTVRFCACLRLGTLAVGRLRGSGSNPEGVERWLCRECFDLETATSPSVS